MSDPVRSQTRRLGPNALSFARAREIVLSRLPAPSVETVDLLASLGRILAREVVADHDHPVENTALRDGFAVSSRLTAEASPGHHAAFEVTQRITAGDLAGVPLREGTCAAVSTGAPVPDGADCVVPDEEVVEEEDRVCVASPCAAGENVRQRGEHFRKGDVLAPAGRQIRPEEVHALASLGRSRLDTWRPPRVAVITTGSELVALGDKPAAGQLWASNLYFLAAYVRMAGGQTVFLGIVPDRREDIENGIRKAEADLVLTTGGTAAGRKDFTREALERIGAEILFDQVAIQPGHSFIFASLAGRAVFCFPGSPGATQTLSWLFLVPAIRKVSGHPSWTPPEVVAVLEKDVPSRRGLARFLPARVSRRAEGLAVRPILTPDRELYSPSLHVNGLLVIPSDVDFLKSGYEVRVILIGEVEPEPGEEIY
jgi:molybdopterin molybdotransferase